LKEALVQSQSHLTQPPTEISAGLNELEALRQKVSEQGNLIEKLQQVAAQNVDPSYKPDPDTAHAVWNMAYNAALASVFGRGLAYYSGSRSSTLKTELELATIRADEATEAYIRVRRTHPSPVKKELQDWQVQTSTNPLVK
jgi:hypothetical protein